MIKNFIKAVLISLFVFSSGYCKDAFLSLCKKCVDLDTQSRKNFSKTAEKIAADYNFQFMTCGLGNMIEDSDALWCGKFLVQYPITLEEMRPIAQNIYAQLWKKMNVDPVFDDYLEMYALSHASLNIPKQPLTPNLLTLKIIFWDQDMNRPLKPYLAQVSVKENKIHYYYADPKTQTLQDPIIEDLPQEVLAVGH